MPTSNLTPFSLHEKLVESISLTKQGFIVVGRLLYELHTGDTFRVALGDGVDSWEAYLAQPEIGLSKGEASRLMQIYETFVLKFGIGETDIAKVPLKNLHYLLPLAKKADANDGEVKELLTEAEHLSQKDFKERVYDLKTGSDERTYEYLVMQRCLETGGLTKVNGITSEEIKEKFDL